MAGLNVKILETSSGIFTVMITGPLDTETSAQFDYHLEKILISSTRAVALDMHGVNYISSMGVGSIFNLRKKAQEHNFAVTMVNLQPQIKKILDTVQAMPQEAIFSSIEELDEYLASLQEKSKEDN